MRTFKDLNNAKLKNAGLVDSSELEMLFPSEGHQTVAKIWSIKRYRG